MPTPPPSPYVVYGIITEKGAPRANITVTITNAAIGGSETRVTDAEGKYIYDDLAQLPNGYVSGNMIQVRVPRKQAAFQAAAAPEERLINLDYTIKSVSVSKKISMNTSISKRICG